MLMIWQRLKLSAGACAALEQSSLPHACRQSTGRIYERRCLRRPDQHERIQQLVEVDLLERIPFQVLVVFRHA
jgi:hypothetical protein